MRVYAPPLCAGNALPVTTRTACATGTTSRIPHTTVKVWRHRQALVNNKFMGYAFAMALGVSPSVENPAHPKYSSTGVGHAERVRGGNAARLCPLA